MTKLDFSTFPATLDVQTVLWLDNPNGWPMSGSIKTLDADIFSEGKQESEPMIKFGIADLPKSVNIATNSNTTFTVNLEGKIEKSETALIQRLQQDCPTTGGGSTRIGVNVTKATVSIWGHDLDLDNLGIFFNATVPCPTTMVDKSEQAAKQTTRHITEATLVV